MALRIISDSACDLPKEITKRYQIEIIPTPVVIEEKDYLDGETIKPIEFYNILREGKKVLTYHINSYMFEEHFAPYAKRGDILIYICFSTGIAGTFNAANIAKETLLQIYPDFDLTIIDSKCASVGFGLVVQMAGMMLEKGESKERIIEAAYYHIEHMRHVFTVETLEFLLKGGRISKTSAIAGSLLDIKPIIEVNKEGALVAIEKVRGRKKSLRRLCNIAGEWGNNLDKQIIGIVHGDDEATMLEVKETLKEMYGITKFTQNYVGCAIGAHTGPGIIAITFMDKVSPYI